MTRSCIPSPKTYWGNVNPIGPRSCYDEGKRCAETLFFDYRRQHRLRNQGRAHLQHLWSAHAPDDGRVVSNFIVQALKGEPITIYGEAGRPAHSVMSTTWSRRLPADGRRSCTGPINLGSQAETTILELAEKIIGSTEFAIEAGIHAAAAGRSRQRQPDLSKAKTLLDWENKIALADGLKETVAYFKHSLDCPDGSGLAL